MISKISRSKIILTTLLLLIMGSFAVFAQHKNKSNEQEKNKATLFGVEQVSFTPWTSTDNISAEELHRTKGLPYRYTADLDIYDGVSSFQIVDVDRVAYLSTPSHEIIITNLKTGHILSRFQVKIGSNANFVIDNDKFYVTGDFEINVYDIDGNRINTTTYPRDERYSGARIVRYNNSTYLLDFNNNSVLIESNGASVEPKELEGIITSSGYKVISKKSADNGSLKLTLISPNGVKSEKAFVFDGKIIGGYFIIDVTENRLIIGVSTYTSDDFESGYEQKIISVGISKKRLGSLVSEISDIYRGNLTVNKLNQNKLYELVQGNKGAYLLTLTEDGVKSYPYLETNSK